MQELPLKIRDVYSIKVNDAQFADTGSGQIQRDRRAEPACPDAQHTGCANFPLSFNADLGQDHMSRIAAEFVSAQFHISKGLRG